MATTLTKLVVLIKGGGEVIASVAGRGWLVVGGSAVNISIRLSVPLPQWYQPFLIPLAVGSQHTFYNPCTLCYNLCRPIWSPYHPQHRNRSLLLLPANLMTSSILSYTSTHLDGDEMVTPTPNFCQGGVLVQYLSDTSIHLMLRAGDKQLLYHRNKLFLLKRKFENCPPRPTTLIPK
jgi:hypothetical protein